VISAKYRRIGQLLGFGLILGSAAAMPADSPQEILKAVDSIRAPGRDFAFGLKVTYLRTGKQPVVQRFDAAVKDASKSLVKFTSPAEIRGRVLLMAGQDLWMYIPTVNQPIRISAQQRLLGPVSNADAARVIYSYDYSAELLGEEKVEGVTCHKLELKPKTAEAAYGRIVLWADNRTHQPIRAQFYAFTGKLLKTASYKGYQTVLGKERPMVVDVRDEIRDGEVSRMEYSRLRIANTPDSYFKKDNLRNVR
jgi:outer membrane lipoprotein-sorting protein